MKLTEPLFSVRFALVALGLTGRIASAVTVGGCTTNPTTGRKQLALSGMSHEDEISMGSQAAPGLTQEFGGEVSNPALRNYVTEVGMKLKDQTEVDGPKRQWVFTLLNSDVINAFALPGERVFITSAIADKMTNEAELAGVLGHEIGHVMARHTAERISQSQLYGGLAAIGGAIAGATIKDPTLAGAVPAIANASGEVVVLKFSRDQESEADGLGMRYMTKAGYNPKGQLEVMQILKQAGGSGGLEMFQTHPLPDTRIQRVQDTLNSDYAYTQTGDRAKNYQFFPDRFQQRYLAVRASEPNAPKPAGAATKQKKRAMADIILGDPTTWCAVCAARAGHTPD